MRTHFFALILLFCCGNIAIAQSDPYQKEYSTGYRGGFIRGLDIPKNAELNFLVIGDWGRCGEYYQTEVADQLAKASVCADASFIVSTGDNIYPRGVTSVNDPLWNLTFENVYHQFSLQKNWYVVLGNHDYKTNPEAEVEYSKKSRRWNMPARYYSIKVPMKADDDSAAVALFVFMDSNPFIDQYYTDPEYAANIKTQDSAAQKAWLINTLSDKDPHIRWRFVFGHHPLYSSGKRIVSPETFDFRRHMKQVFDQYKVDAYICGHEHNEEFLEPQGYTRYFISGSGSESRPVPGNLPESKFKTADHGFMVFSVTNSQLTMQVVNWEGKILYKTTVDHR